MARTLNPEVLNSKPSGIRQIYNMLVNYDDVINLTLGQPDFPTPEHIKEAAIQSILSNENSYSVNSGLLTLRKEVASYFSDKYDVHYNAEDEIIVTCGASEAIDIALRTILEKDDEVIFFAPVYSGYIPLVELNGGKPVIIDTSKNDFKPDLDELKKAVTSKTKAVFFNYPSNPTGVILDVDEIKELTDWLKDQDFYVISDEIYSEVTFAGTHVSFASMEGMYDKTILINGLSKSHSMTGWRIGFTLAPNYISEQMEKVHLFNVVCAPITSQYAAIAALKNGRQDTEPMKQEYIERRDIAYHRLNEMGLEAKKPEGTFYIFPKIPKNYTKSFDFAIDLLKEARVAVVPGDSFSNKGEGYFRISYATSLEDLNKAFDRMELFIKNLQTK